MCRKHNYVNFLNQPTYMASFKILVLNLFWPWKTSNYIWNSVFTRQTQYFVFMHQCLKALLKYIWNTLPTVRRGLREGRGSIFSSWDGPQFLRVGTTAALAMCFQLPNLIKAESPPATLLRSPAAWLPPLVSTVAGMGQSQGLRGWAFADSLQPLFTCPILLRSEHHVYISTPTCTNPGALLETSFPQGLFIQKIENILTCLLTYHPNVICSLQKIWKIKICTRTEKKKKKEKEKPIHLLEITTVNTQYLSLLYIIVCEYICFNIHYFGACILYLIYGNPDHLPTSLNIRFSTRAFLDTAGRLPCSDSSSGVVFHLATPLETEGELLSIPLNKCQAHQNIHRQSH